MMRILTTTVLFSVLTVFGSNFSKDITDINRAYINLNKKVLITQTNSSSGEVILSRKINLLMKSIDAFYLYDEHTALLVTSKYKLVVNHENKIVMLDTNYLNSEEDIPIQLFDSLQNLYSKIEKKIISSEESAYILTPSRGQSKKVELYYNNESMLLKKVRLHLVEPYTQKKVVSTTNYSYSTLNLGDMPPLTKYVKRSNGIFKLNPNYSSYKLINHLN